MIPAPKNKLGNPRGTAVCPRPSPGRGTRGRASRALRSVCVALVCARGRAIRLCGLRGVRDRAPPSPPSPKERPLGAVGNRSSPGPSRQARGFRPPEPASSTAPPGPGQASDALAFVPSTGRRADPALRENGRRNGRGQWRFWSLHGLLHNLVPGRRRPALPCPALLRAPPGAHGAAPPLALGARSPHGNGHQRASGTQGSPSALFLRGLRAVPKLHHHQSGVPGPPRPTWVPRAAGINQQ